MKEEEEKGKRWEKRRGGKGKRWEEEISRETLRREGRKRISEGASWKRENMPEVRGVKRGKKERIAEYSNE